MINQDQNKTNNKRQKVMITGAAGFIGGHITEYFCNNDVDVSCFVRNSSDLSYIKEFPIKIINGSIIDLNKLENSIKNNFSGDILELNLKVFEDGFDL